MLTGIEVVDVPGATAGFDNDYAAQRDAALESLADRDLFLLHVEATDEAGHQGAVHEKVVALERWDAEIIGPLVDALDGEQYRVLLMPDHSTPCAMRTHTSAPVPYLLFDSEHPGPGGEYTERGVAGMHARRGASPDGPPGGVTSPVAGSTVSRTRVGVAAGRFVYLVSRDTS